MANSLEIATLGGLTIKLNGEPVTGLRSRRTEALLVYLVCSGRPHSREVLADLLYDELEQSRALGNLRVLLTNLRQTLGPYVTISRQSVAFNQARPHSLDVTLLETGLATVQKQRARNGTLSAEMAAALARTLALYRGDFLEGFYLRGSPNFEDWQTTQREWLRQEIVQAFHELGVAYLALGDYPAGIEQVSRLVQLDPLNEAGQRQLMRCYASNGQRSAALAQYESLHQILADELGVVPMPETTALYEQIRVGGLSSDVSDVSPAPASALAPAPLPLCPYRGLSAFREQDAPFFFGRESYTARLEAAVQRQALVAVVGPSGSGKSSLVYAGLLPRLRAAQALGGRQKKFGEAGGGAWRIATFRPNDRPFQALAGALLPLLEPQLSETEQLLEAGKLAGSLAQGELFLPDVAARILQRGSDSAGSRLLLVADEFEELYTLCPKPETRERFLDTLLQAIPAVPHSPSPLHLILTLRADFMDQALAYHPLTAAFQEATLLLGPMTHSELAQAIEQPAAVQGVGFETGLVDRLLQDIVHQPGHLPLLEFALTSLWREPQSERAGQLTHDAYEAIGQLEGAVAHYAEDIYASLTPVEQAQTHQIFVQLVRPGQTTEDTRRRASRAELGEVKWALVRHLADARLVITDWDAFGQETAEIVHEALIPGWRRFQEWLTEDRAFRRWQERLRVEQRQWETSGQDDSALLRGTLLAEAEAWLMDRPDEVGQAEQTFIQAGQAFRDQRQQADEAQRRHELVQAQALAEAERQRAELQSGANRQLRQLTAGLVLVFLLAVGAAIVARGQQQRAQQGTEALAEEVIVRTTAEAAAAAERDRAEQQARLALSRQLAAQTISYLDDLPDLALLLSVEANRLAYTGQDKSNLLTKLVYGPYLYSFLHGHTAPVLSVAFSPDGHWLASGGSDTTIILWDVATRQPLGQPLIDHTKEILSLVFSPDGQTLASAGGDGIIILWDVDSGQPIGQPITGHNGARHIAFDPSGQTLASAGSDGTIILWDVASQKPLGPPLTGHTEGINSLAFSPDGQMLASASSDDTIILWNVVTGQPITSPLAGHNSPVLDVAFSPDGQTLASGSVDNTIILWDIMTGQPLGAPLNGHKADVKSVTFSPDGQMLASGSSDNTIILWDMANHKSLGLPLTGHIAEVWSVAFSPDGQTLASSGQDNKIILWDMAAAKFLTGHTTSIRSIALSPDGQTLASGDSASTIILWNTASRQPFDQLTDHTDGLRSVAFSPDGQILASGGDDDTIILWDAATGQPLGNPLTGHDDDVFRLTFSPDGQILASAGLDNTIILWDMLTREPLGPPLTGHTNGVISITFSPDGQILASGGADGMLILWDVASGQPLGSPLAGHSDWVNSVSFSPNGQILASGSEDNTIILWDVATGQPLGNPLSKHTRAVNSITFSPDGQMLASGSSDTTIILWDVVTRQPLGPPLTGHTRSVKSLSFSSDGQTLFSGSVDSTIIQWQLSFESWSTRACRMANRNLTQAEWEQFIGPETPYQRTCPNLSSG